VKIVTKGNDKMSDRQKIKIEIIPDDDIDINKLRNVIHNLINSNREGCKSLRSWIVKDKDDKKQ